MRMGKDVYVEFWKLVRGEAMPALGSDGVYFPDGRWSMWRIHQKAREVGRQRGWYGYMIRSGPMNRPSDRNLLPALEIIDAVS